MARNGLGWGPSQQPRPQAQQQRPTARRKAGPSLRLAGLPFFLAHATGPRGVRPAGFPLSRMERHWLAIFVAFLAQGKALKTHAQSHALQTGRHSHQPCQASPHRPRGLQLCSAPTHISLFPRLIIWRQTKALLHATLEDKKSYLLSC